MRRDTSGAHFGQSQHNSRPSRSVDVVPYPVDWEDIERFEVFGKAVQEIAARRDHHKMGRDFKNLKDYQH